MSPRSRLGSETFLEDIEVIMQSTNPPPVGTTKPPLYPTHAKLVSDKVGVEVKESRKRLFERLVNKPKSSLVRAA